MGCSGRGMGEDELGFEEVDVVTPTQKMLARKLTLRLKRGHSLLVTGGGGWDEREEEGKRLGCCTKETDGVEVGRRNLEMGENEDAVNKW